MNEYQSRYIDLLQNSGAPLSDEQKQEIYDRLLQEAANNPEAARELDIRVANAAYAQSVPSDIATRIIAQGPYVQSQLQQQAPVGQLTVDYLTPLSTAYIRREAQDAIAAIRSERQPVAAQANERTPVAAALSAPKAAYQTSAVFLGAGYNVLRVAEQSLFAVAPLPLQQLKNGIQQVGLPLGVAAIASKIPGADQLINSAMHFGGDLLGNGASAAAGNALSSIGQQIQSGLPNGLGIQTVTSAIGNAVTPVVTNLAQKSGQFFGETATAVGIGKFVINGAHAVFSQVREKGAMRTIEDAIVGAQRAITRTKDFLQSAQTRITNLIKGEKAVSQTQTAQDYNESASRSQMLNQSVGVSESVDSYAARRGDSSITDVELVQGGNTSYNVVQGEYLVPREDLRINPMNADTFLALYDVEGLELGDRMGEDMKLVTPAKVTLGSDGNYQLLEKGQFIAAELYQQQSNEPARVSQSETVASYEPEPVPAQGFYQDIPPEQMQELDTHINGFNPQPEPESDGIQYTSPVAEQAEESGIDPLPESQSETQPQAVAKEAKAPIQKENEDYALSVQNMLAQRGIDTQRFQIDVNGQSAFKMENSLVTQNNLDAKAVEAIKTALNDPANLKGEVRITQGSKVLLHVKDGQVINDPLGITKPSAKVEVNSPSQMLYAEASKDVQGVGLQRTQAIAANAFETGASQTQVMEMIKTHDPEFKAQIKEVGSERGAEMAIGAAVRAAETQVAVAQQPQQATTKEPAMQR